jgi:hypothetical protein
LEEPGIPLHEPITRFYSEEAGELVKLGTTVVEGVGSIDNSPPERVPHEEYIGKDLAKARLLMPLRLNYLECEIQELRKHIEGLNVNLRELVSVLRETGGPTREDGVGTSQHTRTSLRYLD